MNDYTEKNGGRQENSYRPNWQPGNPENGGQHDYYPRQGGYGGGDYYRSSTPPKPEEPYKYNFSDYDSPKGPDKKPPKKGKRGLVVFFSVIAVVLVLSLVSFAGYGVYVMMSGDNFIHDGAESSSSEEAASSSSVPQLSIASSPEIAGSAANDGGLTNEKIAAKVSPSVVKITNFQESSQFGIVGEGSGIIMSKEGYIITNEHVIDGATGIQVTLSDDQVFNASIVGQDTQTDLAVIKIQADPMPDLPVAEFGDSDQLQVGERVIAIGNAGGSEFAGSVTAGIISALSRQITTESGARLEVLQTDAAINPGNSGGALVNKYGQIIGINSAKFVKEGYEGLGFAIPINNAQPIINDLIQNGRVTGRPRLGIKGLDIMNGYAQYMGLPANLTGVMVVSVDPDCNISKQGVVAGDVLTTMNGEPIESMTDLQNDLATFKPGDVVEFEVYRPASQRGAKGQTFTIQVTLDEDNGTTNFPEDQQQQQESSGQEDEYGYDGTLPFPFSPFY